MTLDLIDDGSQALTQAPSSEQASKLLARIFALGLVAGVACLVLCCCCLRRSSRASAMQYLQESDEGHPSALGAAGGGPKLLLGPGPSSSSPPDGSGGSNSGGMGRSRKLSSLATLSHRAKVGVVGGGAAGASRPPGAAIPPGEKAPKGHRRSSAPIWRSCEAPPSSSEGDGVKLFDVGRSDASLSDLPPWHMGPEACGMSSKEERPATSVGGQGAAGKAPAPLGLDGQHPRSKQISTSVTLMTAAI